MGIQELQAKGDSIKPKAQKWVAAGGDPSKIVPLGQQAQQLAQQGKAAEAEAILDQILAIIDPQTA